MNEYDSESSKQQMVDITDSIPISKLEPVGMVAGWGRDPLVVAEKLKAQGVPLVIAAVRDHADPALQEMCDAIEWFGVAKLGGHSLLVFETHQQATFLIYQLLALLLVLPLDRLELRGGLL